jgi:undecaprenyl-diphosphatase
MALKLQFRPVRRRQRLLLKRVPRHESVDAALFIAINHLPHPRNADEYVSLLSDLGKGAGWVVGSFWLAVRGGGRGRRAGVAATAGMFAAVGLAQGPLKAVFHRRRPGRLAIVVGVEPVDSSFPSGHTAGSFAAAAALSAFFPKDRPLLLTAASAVGLSRIYLGHHFPSDVAVGAVLGSIVGRSAARLARFRQPRPVTRTGQLPLAAE